MELRVLLSATPCLRQWGGGMGVCQGGVFGGAVLQKILLPFCHESLLVANDTILIPLNH